MNTIINYIKENHDKSFFKIIALFLFLVLFTGTDLIVKQLVAISLKDKPDVVVIPGVWSYHYVTNDDIGFSVLRNIDKYFSIPEKIKANIFEERIIKKLNNDYYKTVINDYYKKDAAGKYYILDKDKIMIKDEKSLSKDLLMEKTISTEINREILKNIFSSVDYRTQKWIIIVIIQLLATLLVVYFYFRSKLLIHILPLGLIISGAFGNVLDRIIRGYVVDYVMWSFKFIPARIFNPWPIFNLADVYTVIGTICLFIAVFFFTKENDEKKTNLEKK